MCVEEEINQTLEKQRGYVKDVPSIFLTVQCLYSVSGGSIKIVEIIFCTPVYRLFMSYKCVMVIKGRLVYYLKRV